MSNESFADGGHALFGSLPRSGGGGLGLAGSAAGHALVAAALLLVPLLRPVAMPEARRGHVILTYDAPPPPPLPPLRGSSLAPPARRSSPAAPSPPPSALTALVEIPPPTETAPVVADAEADPPGSETGRDTGSDVGMEGGSDQGRVGGVPGGVPHGMIGGTGTGPVIERNYDRPARPIHMTRPVYPQEAFVKKVEGTVLVEIVIDAEGRVARARVIGSVPLLDQAALETVRQWRFAPAFKGGRPVATVAQAPITFRIH